MDGEENVACILEKSGRIGPSKSGLTNMVLAGTRSPVMTTWVTHGPVLKKALT